MSTAKTSKSIAASLLETSDADILDAGLNPLQRLLAGNGWRAEDPAQHPYATFQDVAPEFWVKDLSDGRQARLFPTGQRRPYWQSKEVETMWRFEIYRPKPRVYEMFDLPESAMIGYLRGLIQRLATWNRRSGPVPGKGHNRFFR